MGTETATQKRARLRAQTNAAHVTRTLALETACETAITAAAEAWADMVAGGGPYLHAALDALRDAALAAARLACAGSHVLRVIDGASVRSVANAIDGWDRGWARQHSQYMTDASDLTVGTYAYCTRTGSPRHIRKGCVLTRVGNRVLDVETRSMIAAEAAIAIVASVRAAVERAAAAIEAAEVTQ